MISKERELENHTMLRCREPGCRSLLGILPGSWRVVRPRVSHENVTEGTGALICRKCRAVWVVEELHP